MLPGDQDSQRLIQSTERRLAESLELLGKIHRGLVQNQTRIERARVALRQSSVLLHDVDELPASNDAPADGLS